MLKVMMLKLLEKIFLSLKVESGIFLSYPNTPTTSSITSSQVLTITPLSRGKLLIPPSSLKKRKKIGREEDEREKTMVQGSATTTSVLRVLPSVSPNILKLLVTSFWLQALLLIGSFSCLFAWGGAFDKLYFASLA